MSTSTVHVTLNEETGKLILEGKAVTKTEKGTALIKDSAISVYEFDLKVIPKGHTKPTKEGVAYLTAPIQWTDPVTGKPIGIPLFGDVQRKSDTVMFLGVSQPQPKGSIVGYTFLIMVSYKREVYYHDPILLNEPDGGPGEIKGKPPEKRANVY